MSRRLSVPFDARLAARFARLALGCVTREYPVHPAHVLAGPRELRPPRAFHPAFYGCFDWHSAVHGHWLLAALVKRFPRLPQAAAMRRVLAAHLSERNLRAEARYLAAHPAFERPYGWAWFLRLACELPEQHALEPLARAIEARYVEWLPKQAQPIRSGTHTNTAFGLALGLDYARRFGRRRFERLLVRKSREYFAADRDYPAQWEPGGNDFFSPALVEADLMRRVLPDFPRWLARFLPILPPSLRAPARPLDRRDGQLAHLDGLNLSRAWCFFSLSPYVEKPGDWMKIGDLHLRAGLKHVASGHYAGEHWLATFAAAALAARAPA
jgi:hypothetical protein